jgi:hypothetical protein
MIFVTTYTFKQNLTKAESGELMEVFASAGSAPGTTAHYVNVDGSGGVVISESDDPAAAYRNALNYLEWMTFDTKTVLTVEDAVPQIADYLS